MLDQVRSSLASALTGVFVLPDRDDVLRSHWLELLAAVASRWRAHGGVVFAVGEGAQTLDWADRYCDVTAATPIGPRALSHGANLHAHLRGDASVQLVIAPDRLGWTWAVLESRRQGHGYENCTVVGLVSGPGARARFAALERALDLQTALAERLDDHLPKFADVMVFPGKPELEWFEGHAPGTTAEVLVCGSGEIDEIAAGLISIAQRVREVAPAGRQAEPLVTAVITHYNRPAMVRRAIESLLGQTWSNLEILVVDDGSSHSDVPALFEDLGSGTFSRPVRLIRKENGGLGSARNVGLREAAGEYVTFLDDDDEAEPTYVEYMVEALLATGAAASAVGFRVFNNAEQGPLDGRSEDLQWMYFGPASDLAILDNVIGGAAAMMKRDIALSVGGYHEIKHLTYEDWQLLLKIALAGHEIVPVPEPLLRYRVSPSSMLRTFPLWGSHDQVIESFQEALPSELRAWPELILGLHTRCEQHENSLAAVDQERSELLARLAAAEHELNELRLVAAHRDALLASTTWRIGSVAAKAYRSVRSTAGRQSS